MANQRFSAIILLFAVFFFVLAMGKLSVTISPGYAAYTPSGGASPADDVPPYHPASPPEKNLPATLDPAQFPDSINKNAYAMAAKIKSVLYQQPCYCHCDKEFGHNSLLDCFAGTHGAVCNVCKWEAIYAYNETARKKSVEQIREGILKGHYKKIDLAKYREYKPNSAR